ncbi:tyrosine-type recombinase/integrase [Variovorax sp. GB1R11]|uniref:tyrosine-type recombinase/integrase n=1 Tax=Variovorax sp. GB1R11 TaxID=3443741 RepID=UPI003F446D99
MNTQPRTRPRLTVDFIERAQPSASRKSPRLFCDSNGLYLQVTPQGNKSWIFRYTIDRRTRSMGLGPLRKVGLESARKKARALRIQVDLGVDPLEEKSRALAARKTGLTFEDCGRTCHELRRDKFRNDKHFAQWGSTLETYAYPKIGHIEVAAITVDHVLKVVQPIWKDKTETASRLRGRIEAVLAWATVSGHRAGDNPARWKGFLDQLLAAPADVKEVQHHPALPYGEMPSFCFDLQTLDGDAAQLFLFLIFTAARIGEARAAMWTEFDSQFRTWTVPADRMKAGRMHRVPLPTQVTEMLKARVAKNASLEAPSPFVFPGRKAKACMSNGALTALLKRMRRMDLTAHGCRSTFRDWVAECTEFQREVAEACLAHVLGNKTEAAYQRGDYLEKRRLVMQAWTDYCLVPPRSAPADSASPTA